MKKTIYLESLDSEICAAIVERGRLAEYIIETRQSKDIVGNVYKGRVTNVLAGMQAAFVNCGLDKNCYLAVGETFRDASVYDGGTELPVPSKLDLAIGDEVLVQVVKGPIGKKGAKVSTHLSYVGKNFLYLPNTDFVGISRKLTDSGLRYTMLNQADKLRKNHKEGLIVRTRAPYATYREMQAEVEQLRKTHSQVEQNYKTAKVGDLLYEEDSLAVRLLRDCLPEEIEGVYVSGQELYAKLYDYLLMRGNVKKLVPYNGTEDFFKHYGLADQIADIYNRQVPLEFGANLVIESTEAMTVIDVNTGGFTGMENLEHTAFSTNILAAREIARQVRLRNIGGIITVDFVDMAEESHRLRVVEELQHELAADKAQCKVLPMNDLCLVCFTRRRVAADISSLMRKPCPHCKGEGFILSDEFLIHGFRSGVNELLAQGYTSVIVDLNAKFMNMLLSERIFTPLMKKEWKDKRIYMIPHKTYHEETMRMQGSKEAVLTLPGNAQLLY